MPAAEKSQTIQRCPKNACVLEYESQSALGRAVWYACVPSEHSIEDVLRPEYFGLMQSQTQLGKVLRARDIIDVEPENGRWRLQLRVMGLRLHVQQVLTREQARWDFSVKEPSGFRFVFNSAASAWSIFKGNVEVDTGFATEDECLARVTELQHEKAA